MASVGGRKVGGRNVGGCFIRQVYLETSRLAGCLTPVGITDEVVHRCWEGCSCSASRVSDADGC